MIDFFRLPAIDTLNTTRILGRNIFQFNTYLTKLVYPSTNIDWRPNAVILAPNTSYHYGLAATPIIHFPINAPIIFTPQNILPMEVLNEIMRLSPSGKNLPGKVILVGPISPVIENQIKAAGFTTVRIGSKDPIETAGDVLEFRYRIPPQDMEGKTNIMIVSPEDYREAIPAGYFSAHMGVPILFAYRNKLPDVTRNKLMKYKNRNVYVVGSQNSISNGVLNEIRKIVTGKVDRIGGRDAAETAVNFSKYYDPKTMFGWNINKKDGWSFSLGREDSWAENIASSILAHLGKHGPLLYVGPDTLPSSTRDYILSLNPGEKHPPTPPFMHGYILGDFNKISRNAQIEAEKALILHGKPSSPSPKPKM